MMRNDSCVRERFTAHFVGMTQEESLPMLRQLCEHAVLPSCGIRVGSVMATMTRVLPASSFF